MLPDRVSKPGPLTYESGALPIGCIQHYKNCDIYGYQIWFLWNVWHSQNRSQDVRNRVFKSSSVCLNVSQTIFSRLLEHLKKRAQTNKLEYKQLHSTSHYTSHAKLPRPQPTRLIIAIRYLDWHDATKDCPWIWPAPRAPRPTTTGSECIWRVRRMLKFGSTWVYTILSLSKQI